MDVSIMLLPDEYTQLYKQEFSTHGYDEILYPHSVKHFVKETQPKNEYFHHKCRLILGFN